MLELGTISIIIQINPPAGPTYRNEKKTTKPITHHAENATH